MLFKSILPPFLTALRLARYLQISYDLKFAEIKTDRRSQPKFTCDLLLEVITSLGD